MRVIGGDNLPSLVGIGLSDPLSVFHTIMHNQHNQAQSHTIAQSHNQNAHFCTIAQSKCQFSLNCTIKFQILQNQTQSYTIKQNHFLKHF